MKTLKKANQKNVHLNTYRYSESEIREMLANKEVWFYNKKEDRAYDYDFWGYDYEKWASSEEELRIGCEEAELKVVLDESGYYTTVLIRNGKTYYINL